VVAFVTTVLAGTGAVALAASNSSSEVRPVLLTMVVVVAVAALLATVVLTTRYLGGRPTIEFDASGRWVTLRGAHPAFAAAVRDEPVTHRLPSS
jgi:hypothetical protein